MATAAATAALSDFAATKIAKPLFDAAGRLVDKTIHQLEDTLDHHNEDGAHKICGIDLIIRERALDMIAHRLSLEIVWSPDNKINGTKFENSGSHAQEARHKVIDCFKVLVKFNYKNYPGFTNS